MSAVESITLFNGLFYVFLGIAALGLLLAVFFFFYFDIPTLRAVMTGKAKEESIRKIEEQNKKTGNLRFQYPVSSGDMKRHGHTGKMDKSGKLGRSAKLSQPEPQPVQTYAAPPAEERLETGVLSQQTPETAVLNYDAPETTALGVQNPPVQEADDAGQTAPLRPVAPDFRFEITQNIIVIHTDELI